MSHTEDSIEQPNLNALDLASESNNFTESKLERSSSLTSCSSNKSNEYEVEISRLRDLVRQKENENAQLESRVLEIEHQSKLEVENLNASLNQKLEESLKKIVTESQKDKNSMVMKYVEVERKCIEMTKSMQIQQSKVNDTLKEKQRLMDKMSQNKNDYEKLRKDNETKLKDLMEKKKEIERLKEKIVLNDAKESASIIKLKAEVEAHGQTKSLVEELKTKISSLESKSNLSDSETQTSREISENLRSISPSTSEIDILKKELNLLKSQIKEMFEERTILKEKVKQLENDKNHRENLLQNCREKLKDYQNMNNNLLNENLQLKNQHELWNKDFEAKKEMEHQIILYKSELNDLEQEMEENKSKQSELLEFTSKLTEKNSLLQSENCSLNEKLETIKCELEKTQLELLKSNDLVKNETEKLRQQLDAAQTEFSEIVKKLEEKSTQIDELKTKLGDSQDENLSMKKKYDANIKDLTRQLKALQKKQISNSSTPIVENQIKPQNSSSSVQKISRTSSVNSLNYPDEETRSLDSNFCNNTSFIPPSTIFNNEVVCGNATNAEDVYIVDVDKQKIIDKIVKLQKTLAKRNEKIDFLQEHVDQLTNDLKKKTKIIQAFAMAGDDVGAFTSEKHDLVKRELARKTSNLIGNDSHMNNELCYEINKKLQALLEDTLIKNLTLKENLETLGREIANLSKENRELKTRLSF